MHKLLIIQRSRPSQIRPNFLLKTWYLISLNCHLQLSSTQSLRAKRSNIFKEYYHLLKSWVIFRHWILLEQCTKSAQQNVSKTSKSKIKIKSSRLGFCTLHALCLPVNCFSKMARILWINTKSNQQRANQIKLVPKEILDYWLVRNDG